MVYVFTLTFVFHSDDRENMGLDGVTSLLLSARGDTTPVSMYDDASFAPHVANEDIHRAKQNPTVSSPLNPIPFSGRCFPCIPPLLQGSSALVPGQYMPLYNPLSLAGITSAPPVQDESEQVPVECHYVFVDIYLLYSNVNLI